MNGLSKIIIISMLFCTIAVSCRKDPLDYTSRMAGTHQLTGLVYKIGSSAAPHLVSDTDSVYVVNNSTIIYTRFGRQDTMHCSSTDKKYKTSTFTYHYRSLTGMPFIEDHDTVIYNYSNNGIVYTALNNYNNNLEYLRAHN